MKKTNYAVSGSEVHEILGPYLLTGQTAASGNAAQCKDDCTAKYRVDTEKLISYTGKQLVKYQDLSGELANNFEAFFWCGTLTKNLQPGYELPYEEREAIIFAAVTDLHGNYLTDLTASSPDASKIQLSPINLGTNDEIKGMQLNISLANKCTGTGQYNAPAPDKTILIKFYHSVFGSFELNALRKCYNINQFCYLQHDGMYIHPSDKSRFYICTNGETAPMSCAPGLEFDPLCYCCTWPKEN